MQRISTPTRAGWQKIVQSQGLLFHSLDGVPYWNESVYYLFESTEIDQIEAATHHLNQMCLTAVGHVIGQRLLGAFGIPPAFHDFVVQSWEQDDHTIYGRFDLVYDGNGPPKLLEYNADTPTALLEAAVIQWFWFQDLMAGADEFSRVGFDQFNSLHERLIEAWARVRTEIGDRVVLAADGQSVEDMMTITYLCDTAVQAGL
jgi:glutathionylspermidine synthase